MLLKRFTVLFLNENSDKENRQFECESFGFIKVNFIIMLQKNNKFPFDLGRAFPTFIAYLTTKDKLSLSTTCSLLRHVVFRSETWHQFNIYDYETGSHWSAFLSWVGKYLDIIEPVSISLAILDKTHEQDKNLLKLFLKERQYVKKVEIRCNSDLLHLAVAHSCPNLQSLTIHSSIASDLLLQSMLKHCPQVKDIEINADSLEFTALNLKQYLKNPLERLVLKPYQLNYQELIRLLCDEDLNQIVELQIDVEECSEGLLSQIVSHLVHIKKLRLYHMEKFWNQESIASKLTAQITELSLTKCHSLKLDMIIGKVLSLHLQRLDLTDAVYLRDEEILKVADVGMNLLWLNVSWCNELTNNSVSKIVERCLKLQGLIVTGIKSLNDDAFVEYSGLKSVFNQKRYDEIRFEFKKQCKLAKNGTEQILDVLQKKARSMLEPVQFKTKTLRSLRHLECNSCNNISDTILKIIYCSNRMATVTNYYGEVLSLFYTSELSDDDYF